MARFLVTGAAGFIGFHLVRRLLAEGHVVLGIDDLNGYYPVHHKVRRRRGLTSSPRFRFAQVDVADAPAFRGVLDAFGTIDQIVHLAAYPGVLPSAEHPAWYVQANLVGFATVLEAARHAAAPLLFASSSSVYGARPPPLATTDPVHPPQSFYAATKVANEAMGHSYAAQFGLPVTAVRFFNVYGPFGRPDMAVYRFTEQIAAGAPVQLRNHGRMTRDLTYVDDAVEAIVRLTSTPFEGYRAMNVGRGEPTSLVDLVSTLERVLGTSARVQHVDRPDGEVIDSWACVADLEATIGFRPQIGIDEGLTRFVRWWRSTEPPTSR